MNNKLLKNIIQVILDFYLLNSNIEEFENNGISLKVFQAVEKHKLEGRINIDEIKEIYNFHNLGLHFIACLMVAKYEIENIFKNHVTAMEEINKKLEARGIKEVPIIVKGLSIYGTTNNTLNVRRNADIDLLYSDPPLLEMILRELNYEKKETFSQHEYCVMINGAISIEIHNYIPVTNYSNENKRNAKKAMINNKKIFFESNAASEECIFYEDIVNGARVCDYLGKMFIPDVNYQALILCSHIFRNYTNSLFSFSSHVIIAELLDLLDLFSHHTFDVVKFSNITIKNKGIDSVKFVNYLLEQMFGNCILREITSEYLDWDGDLVFSKILQWSGSMYIPSRKEEFIYFGIKEFIDDLGTEEVLLPMNKTGLNVPNIDRYSSHEIQHVISVNPILELNFIILNVNLEEPINSQVCDVFEVFFENKRCCFGVEDKIISTEERPEGCFWELSEVDYTIKLAIPIRLLKVYRNSEIGLILSIVRWGTNKISTLIPIKIKLSYE